MFLNLSFDSLVLFLLQCIEVLGLGFLSQEAMQEMLRILDRLIKDHFERAEARVEKRKDEDYDEVCVGLT